MNINNRYIVSFSLTLTLEVVCFVLQILYGIISLSTCFAYYNQKLALDGFGYCLGYFRTYRSSICLFKTERIIGYLIVRTPKQKFAIV